MRACWIWCVTSILWTFPCCYSVVGYVELLFGYVELLFGTKVTERFKYVLVDEFQDTSRLQFQLLKLLGRHGRVTAVGDDWQSIYSFQGAYYSILNLPLLPSLSMVREVVEIYGLVLRVKG
jgi:hypothetical protein